MLFHTPTQGHLLALLGANGTRQLELCQVVLDGNNACSSAHGSDVEHQDFTLRHLGDLGGKVEGK